MAIIAPQLKQRFFTTNGLPLAGGKLYSYAAGTTTPQATYTDSTGVTPNANPVILDANGECSLWLGTSSYKFVLKNSADVTQWTTDNVSFPGVENGFSTGDVKISIKTIADAGWVLMDDKTIGNSSSSATGRANDDTLALYTLLWDNTVNANCAVSSGRGASAAADFAANKTIALPKALGRALAVYGSGASLTARALAAVVGAETHQLSSTEMPSHTHTFTGTAHSHAENVGADSSFGNSQIPRTSYRAGKTESEGWSIGQSATSQTNTLTIANATAGGTNSNTGGDGSHNNMQPTLFLNVMIKL